MFWSVYFAIGAVLGLIVCLGMRGVIRQIDGEKEVDPDIGLEEEMITKTNYLRSIMDEQSMYLIWFVIMLLGYPVVITNVIIATIKKLLS